MHKTRQQMLAALGALVFADAPGAAGGSGSGPAGDNPGEGVNGAQEAAQASQDGQDGDEDGEDGEDSGSKADDPRLRKARDEAYTNRVKARDAEKAATAAAEEKDALIQQIGKALGLVNDGEDEAPDADALTRQLTEQSTALEAVTGERDDARRELAVFKAAAKAGGDPEKLLDSRRFLDSVKDVDPTDTAAVTAAVKDAVASNPDLASRRERGASTADTASGPGGGSAPKAEVSLHDALAARYGTN